MNESVLAMIDKLHARLDDLAQVVREIPFELSGYDKKLDKIDDQVYLIEVELEKKLAGSVPLKPLSGERSAEFDEAALTGASQASTEKATSAATAAPAESQAPKKESSESTGEDDNEDDKETEGFLSESAKETLAGATRTLNSIYKDGKEVVGEFSEAFSDIKDTLGVKNIFKKR